MKLKNERGMVGKVTEERCRRLEELAKMVIISADDRRALLDSAKIQRNWCARIEEHMQGEQSRNISLSGAMLQIIKLASDSLGPWTSKGQMEAWMRFKKGGRK